MEYATLLLLLDPNAAPTLAKRERPATARALVPFGTDRDFW
jgi:hypothetical protein